MGGRSASARVRAALLAGFAGILVLPGVPLAASTSGRVASTLYVFERADTVDVESTHARISQTFQIGHRAGKLGVGWYGQVDGDVATRLADDPKLRTYGLWVEWRDLGEVVDVRVGRQPVFAGVASGTFDGARVRVDATPWLKVQGFGGGLLPTDQETRVVDDVGNNWLAGGQVVATPTADTRIGASFLERHRRRPAWEATRADSVGNLFTRLVEPTDRETRLGGLDASWTVRPEADLRGRLDWDFLAERVSRGEVSVRSRVSGDVGLRGAWIWRAPRLPGNSIFSVFDADESHEAEIGASWQSRPALRLHGSAAGVFHPDDTSWRASVGVDARFGSLAYVRRGGSAGELDGVSASTRRALLGGRLTPGLDVSWASYRLDPDRGERETAFAGSAGVDFRPRTSLSIDARLQVLRDRHYDRDVRFLLRFQHWFFRNWAGPGGGGAR